MISLGYSRYLNPLGHPQLPGGLSRLYRQCPCSGRKCIGHRLNVCIFGQEPRFELCQSSCFSRPLSFSAPLCADGCCLPGRSRSICPPRCVTGCPPGDRPAAHRPAILRRAGLLAAGNPIVAARFLPVRATGNQRQSNQPPARFLLLNPAARAEPRRNQRAAARTSPARTRGSGKAAHARRRSHV